MVYFSYPALVGRIIAIWIGKANEVSETPDPNPQESQEPSPAPAQEAPEADPPKVDSRWLKVCQGADQLEDEVLRSAEGGTSPLPAALSVLENLLEDFPAMEDPSQDIHAFAIHRLAYSVYEAVAAAGAFDPKSD